MGDGWVGEGGGGAFCTFPVKCQGNTGGHHNTLT